ncbi:MAG TPA: M13 family metallopeptidase [Bacteroidia bacterium]|jgi:putative endopeptidase|nr:M13 family metallopeptidase [Bacteroidia bacterium]
MKKYIVFLSFASAIALLSSCNNQPKNTESTGPDELVSHIDSTISPAQDFFMFANGKWFKNNPIPNSERQNGIFQTIQDTINAQIHNLCMSCAKLTNAEPGSAKQKIGDFFYTAMDSVTLNKNGITDVKPDLDKIENIKDMKGLIEVAAYISTVSGRPFFDFEVGQDERLSSKNAVHISQGGLSLPTRDYYFDMDARAVMVREKFVKHVKNMYEIMGYDSVKAMKAADNLMKLETTIAKTSRKREDTRDPLKNYKKIPFKELISMMPNFDWNLYVQSVGLTNVDSVILGQPEFLTALNGYFKSFPLEDWKNYLKLHYMQSLASYVDDKTYMEVFSFYATTMLGVKEPKPRWKRAVEETDGSLGDLIGEVYVSDYLPKGTKEKLMQIAKDIKAVYASRIKNLDWMSPGTKEKALHKLDVMIMKVGYPDKWKDMSSLKVDRTSYVKNVMNANLWEFHYMIGKYGKPVDRTEWDMEPQTYNAYYNPSNNEIVVPGCNIIIPGYEHHFADDALLYSIIGGSTFGHEMTHGFDDQGSKYDEFGNLHNWWTPEDSAKFYAKTKMIVKQFNSYVVVDSLHINGEMTQGENIADLGGIMFGYEAFKQTKQYKDKEIIGGLNPDQRFFIGYAYAWMINTRPEALANQVKSNEHSPAEYRVIGPLTDMPEFFTTFNIKPGDKMWRPDSLRVRIW